MWRLSAIKVNLELELELKDSFSVSLGQYMHLPDLVQVGILSSFLPSNAAGEYQMVLEHILSYRLESFQYPMIQFLSNRVSSSSMFWIMFLFTMITFLMS